MYSVLSGYMPVADVDRCVCSAALTDNELIDRCGLAMRLQYELMRVQHPQSAAAQSSNAS